MQKHIIDSPSDTTFEEAFQWLESALDEYRGVGVVPDEDSLAWAIDKSVSRFFGINGVDLDLTFHRCILTALGSSAAAGVSFRDLYRARGNIAHSVAQTLTRSMIMSASKVIYVYADPDRESMGKKAVSMLAQEFRYAASAAKDFDKFQHYVGLGRGPEWSEQLRKAGKLSARVQDPEVETKIIKTAVRYLSQAITDNVPNIDAVSHVIDEQVAYSWRFMSANAHGYAWPALYGADANFSPGSPADDFITASMLLSSASSLARQACEQVEVDKTENV